MCNSAGSVRLFKITQQDMHSRLLLLLLPAFRCALA
jgi:hypothetical protein